MLDAARTETDGLGVAALHVVRLPVRGDSARDEAPSPAGAERAYDG